MFLKHEDQADDHAGGQQRKGEDDGPAVHGLDAFQAPQAQPLAGQRLGAQAMGLHEIHQAGEEADTQTDGGQQQQSAVQRAPGVLDRQQARAMRVAAVARTAERRARPTRPSTSGSTNRPHDRRR